MSESAARVSSISVIVPTYRRFEPLLQTLDGLLTQDYPDFEVIVVDQNPAWPEPLQSRLRRLQSDPHVVWLRQSVPGVVAARNTAVSRSRGDVLLFVDDDVDIPQPSLLRCHVRHYEQPEIAAVVGRERPVGDDMAPHASAADASVSRSADSEGLTPLQQAMQFNRNSGQLQRVRTFCTCNSSIRRSAFMAIGGFDELFTGNAYGDDYDLALRLDAAGFQLIFDPEAALIHRRVPAGGLRLSDPGNDADTLAMAQGLWVFVLRHGHRGMYGYLIWHYILRKTVFLRRNLGRPLRQLTSLIQVIRAYFVARRVLRDGPRLRFAP